MVQNSLMLRHLLIQFSTSSRVSERMNERSGVRERSEPCRASERVRGASEQANGRVRGAREQANGRLSGLVLQSVFLAVLAHSVALK